MNKIINFTNIQEENIINLYTSERKTIKYISLKFNCSISKIQRFLKNKNLLKNKSESHIGLQSGENHPNYRKFNNEEINNIINKYKSGNSLKTIGINLNLSTNCISRVLKENNIKIRNLSEAYIISNSGKIHPMKGKHHSLETIELIKQNHADISGCKNPNYIDGRTKLPYCKKFNNNLRESVRIRDNHTCQLCGKIQNGRRHTVHHVHYDKQNCFPDLIILCNSCNAKVNKKSLRKQYEELFMNKLNDRQLLFWTKQMIK